MKLVALCGLHGAGKDTVADALPARKMAFADTLYREVSDAFGVTTDWLKHRSRKEDPAMTLALCGCDDEDFISFVKKRNCTHDQYSHEWVIFINDPRSPRQILQWWGDYRRAKDPEYFVNAVCRKLRYATVQMDGAVITDCRFPNEAAMVRKLGGQIWQIVRTNHNPPCNGHASETTGDEFKPDVIFLNNGTLQDLQNAALEEWNK